jgi:hypothetical protein
LTLSIVFSMKCMRTGQLLKRGRDLAAKTWQLARGTPGRLLALQISNQSLPSLSPFPKSSIQ